MKKIVIILLVFVCRLQIFAYGQVEEISTATPTIFPENEIGIFKSWTGVYDNYYNFINSELLIKEKESILKVKPSYTKQGLSSFLYDTYYSPIKSVKFENNTITYNGNIDIKYKFMGAIKIGYFPLYYFKAIDKNVDKKYKVVLITEPRSNLEHFYYVNFHCGASIRSIKNNLTIYPTFYNVRATIEDKIQFFKNKLYDITLKPALHEYNGLYEDNVVVKAPNIIISNINYKCTRIANNGDYRVYSTDKGIKLYIKKEYIKYNFLTYILDGKKTTVKLLSLN